MSEAPKQRRARATKPTPADDLPTVTPETAVLDAPETPEPEQAPEEPTGPVAVVPVAYAAGGRDIDADKLEYVDAENGKPIKAGDVFEKENEHGTIMVARRRVLERRTLPGLAAPVERLLLPAGARLSEAQAAVIVAHIESV